MSTRMKCSSTGKRIYWTPDAAHKAVWKASKHGMRFAYYGCKFCTYWHLATRRKKRREKPDDRVPDRTSEV